MDSSVEVLRSGPRRLRIASCAALAGIATTVLVASTAPAALAGEKPGDHDEKATAKITVVKKVVPAETTGEDVTGAVPAAGWSFTGTSTTTGVGGLPATHTTGADGAATFDVTFPAAASTVELTVAETQQPGFELVTQGGANAVCSDRDEHAAVPVVDDDSVPGRPAFRLLLGKKQQVKCVVYNRPVPPTPPVTPPEVPPTTPPEAPPVTPPVTTPPVTPPAAAPTPPQGGVLGTQRQGRPRLRIEKRASDSTVTAGDVVRFTIVVRNSGNVAALRLRICDRLPRDVTIVDRNGGTLVSGGRVCWRVRRLAAGATVRRVLVVRVDRDARPGTLLNRATVGRRRAETRVRVRQPGQPPSVGGEQVTG